MTEKRKADRPLDWLANAVERDLNDLCREARRQGATIRIVTRHEHRLDEKSTRSRIEIEVVGPED